MAKKDKERTKESCLLDYRTGQFTQRELSNKHDLSLGTVNRLTKDVEKSLERAVHSVSSAAVAVHGLSGTEMNTVHSAANTLTADTLLIHTLTNSNLKGVAAKLLEHEELDMLAHKNAQDLIDKASITLGVNQRHANNSINVDASANANNETKKIIIVDAVAEKAKAEQE